MDGSQDSSIAGRAEVAEGSLAVTDPRGSHPSQGGAGGRNSIDFAPERTGKRPAFVIGRSRWYPDTTGSSRFAKAAFA